MLVASADAVTVCATKRKWLAVLRLQSTVMLLLLVTRLGCYRSLMDCRRRAHLGMLCSVQVLGAAVDGLGFAVPRSVVQEIIRMSYACVFTLLFDKQLMSILLRLFDIVHLLIRS
jgi:hypothetical protein